MRQAGFVALTATTLATVLRYTPALSAPHIVAVTLAVLAVGAFFASRLWNDEAPVDEWLPSLFMVGAIASAGVVRSHHTISVTLTTHVSGLLTTVLVGTSLLGLLSAYRRSATWRAQAGLALQGPVLLVVQYGHHPHHLAWSVGMVAAGVVALYVSLTTFANPERKFIASGAAVPAALFLLSQLATFYDRQHYFRVDVTLLAVLATIVAARRRESRIPTPVLVGGAAVVGLAWADNFQRIDHYAFWIIGGAVLLLGLLRGVRNDDSWTSLAPGLVFGFIPGVVSVTSEGSLAARSGVLILAIAVTVVGYITRRDAPIEIGSVAAALTLTIESPTSTTWTVLTVALAVLWFLAGTQRRFPSVQITPRAGLITALAGVAMWLDSLSYQIVHLHNSRVLEIVLVGLVTVAAARRLSWTFDGMHFLAASGLVGVAWTSSFHSIPGAGVWIGVGGALLLALSLGVDTPTHRSWIEWGPSLLFVMIPANYSALSGSVVSAAVTILVAVALVIIAIAQRKRAVFDVAIATFAILSAARLSQVVSDKSRWIVAVVVGVALIGNGLWRETRSARGHRQDDEASTSWYRSLT
jgi:hypothetical protein